jgi:hypothetical protein
VLTQHELHLGFAFFRQEFVRQVFAALVVEGRDQPHTIEELIFDESAGSAEIRFTLARAMSACARNDAIAKLYRDHVSEERLADDPYVHIAHAASARGDTRRASRAGLHCRRPELFAAARPGRQGGRAERERMVGFYRALAQSLPKSEALRQAKLALRDAGYPPSAWAGFLFAGSDAALSVWGELASVSTAQAAFGRTQERGTVKLGKRAQRCARCA